MARLSEILLPSLVIIIILLIILSFVTPGLTHLENLLPTSERGIGQL
ncbi:MAG: hypothetical protein HPY52_03155 [Firmicutes bacterium]|nr:hypothetical protein [Bacillota bacterium]